MWSWRPSYQIKPHQDTYEAVASQLRDKFGWDEYISFYTIVANYNGVLAADIAHINDVTHIKVAKYEATLTLKLTPIRPHTKL